MAVTFAELKRRHIYRIAAAYVVVAWVLLQVFNNVNPLLGLPAWVGVMVLVLLVGGFPVALVFAWVVELKAAPVASGKGASLLSGEAGGGTGAPPSQVTPAGVVPLPCPTQAQDAASTDCRSLVVLPFANISGEQEQDFFADGLTEDIITDLSHFRDLFVISRNSSAQYKGKTLPVREIARELHVQYVVQGSVRKMGSRIRISVQLIDGHTDRHIWAERYDREIADIFALQDEITGAIVATLPGRVEAAVGEQAGRKPTENMTAYECVLTGKLLHHRSTPDDNREALKHLERAITLDPNYAHAHAWKACVLGQAWANGYATNREAAFGQAASELKTALRLDSNDSDVHRILAAVALLRNDHEKAMLHQDRAIALNPNDDLVVVQQGEILTWAGRSEEGIAWIQKAMRLNPCHPERFWGHLGRAYFVAQRYADARTAFGRISVPDAACHSWLAACDAELGDNAAAARESAEVLRLDPKFSVASFLRTLHYKRSEDLERHRAALQKAGLPSDVKTVNSTVEEISRA